MQDQSISLIEIWGMREELSNSLPCSGGGLNVQSAPQPTPRHPDRSRPPWIRAFLLEARRSGLMVSIFKKSQNRNKTASRAEGIIRLLLIILWALVVVVLGLYSGLVYHHR
jgi:hypothetical protein